MVYSFNHSNCYSVSSQTCLQKGDTHWRKLQDLIGQESAKLLVTNLQKVPSWIRSSFFLCFRRLQKLLRLYNTSTNTELQQRSVEYDSLFRSGDSIRTGLLERMPVPEKTSTNGAPVTNGNAAAGGEHEDDLLEGGNSGLDMISNKHNLKQQPEVRARISNV